MCVYIPPSHSFNSVSLTSLRGSKLEAIATHTFPLQLSAWHQIYIHNEQAQHFSCCLAHGLHVNQRAGFFSKWTFVPVHICTHTDLNPLVNWYEILCWVLYLLLKDSYFRKERELKRSLPVSCLDNICGAQAGCGEKPLAWLCPKICPKLINAA